MIRWEPWRCEDVLWYMLSAGYFPQRALQEGKVFDGQTLAGMDTDFEGVRAAYAKLFNVLALKFSQHGSESIQKTEIAMISARLQAFLSNPALQSIASGEQPVSRVGTSTSTNGASIQSMTGFDSPDMFPPPKERETFEKWQELDLSCRAGTAVITSTDSLPINIVQEAWPMGQCVMGGLSWHCILSSLLWTLAENSHTNKNHGPCLLEVIWNVDGSVKYGFGTVTCF